MEIISEFKNGTMILTHPSGVVSIYTPADIKKLRDEKQVEVDRLKNEIVQDNILISSMEA